MRPYIAIIVTCFYICDSERNTTDYRLLSALLVRVTLLLSPLLISLHFFLTALLDFTLRLDYLVDFVLI